MIYDADVPIFERQIVLPCVDIHAIVNDLTAIDKITDIFIDSSLYRQSAVLNKLSINLSK
ncbi:hypothetical protein AALH95_06200 [Staphylococcus nepalensis]|uniref:hypothetical protein n=1 Tax=Staphylococcus nepalensis TaxID=214473 RepID=UPI003516F2A9